MTLLPSDAGAATTTANNAPRITILGVGNTLMGDDGAGVVVAQALEDEDLGGNVRVVIGLTADLGLIKHFLESDLIIFVDAIDAGAEPGAIFRFHPDEAGITGLRSNNIHGMGVSYLLTNARLKGADPQVIIFAVQVVSIIPRDRELSPPVEAAVKRVGEMVAEEVARRRQVASTTVN